MQKITWIHRPDADTDILGVYNVGNYTSVIYPRNVCTTCPFFSDGMVSWCGWYKERIVDPNYNERCKVKKIEVEEM